MKKDTVIETERDKAIRRVMRNVARGIMVEPLPVKKRDGTTPIVVALPDDKIADVEARVDRAGGVSNVFVAYPDHLLLCVYDLHSEEHGEPADVHPDSSIAMVLDWVKTQPAAKAAIRVTTPTLTPVRELEYAF